MLRFVYRCLLRLHPPYFRRRFSREMLSIFEQQKETLAAAKLVADGVLSLLRQWVLRPEFWEEPVALPAPNGVPTFHMIKGFRPRAGSLFDGALMSVAVFTFVCVIMQHTWNHPVLMPAISVYRSGSPISWRSPSSSPAPSRSNAGLAGENAVYIDGARIVLVIQTSPPSRTQPRPKADGSR